MLQPGYGLGLVLETADELGVIGELLANDFDRHLAADAGLVGQVNGAKGPSGRSLPSIQSLVSAARGATRMPASPASYLLV